jgi:hypothetical protein
MARKTAGPTLYAANSIWGRHSHLEGSFSNTDPWAAPAEIWVSVANVTNEFILGLNILREKDASVDLGHPMLHPTEEEFSLWCAAAGLRPSNLVVANDRVMPGQCEGVVTALHFPCKIKILLEIVVTDDFPIGVILLYFVTIICFMKCTMKNRKSSPIFNLIYYYHATITEI